MSPVPSSTMAAFNDLYKNIIALYNTLPGAITLYIFLCTSYFYDVGE